MKVEVHAAASGGGTRQVSKEELLRRARFWSRVFMVTIVCTLPVTAVALWLLTYLPLWPNDLDVHGLIAVSIGILGILVFFIFLYKYQMLSTMTRRGRILSLVVHGVFVLLFFLVLVWIGYDAPWREVQVWGDYSVHDTIKSWVIAVLVIGSISLLGSLFDFVRRRLAGEYGEV